MTKEEALNEIRSWAIPSKKGREVLETLIPELAESEDERIKKQLIDSIKIGCSNSGISFTKEAADRYIAWLEKREEQKPAEWSEDDEDNLCRVIRVVEDNDSDWKELTDWLKSLRPSWKPSEQEKGALRTAISVLTEERSFPKAAANLQTILDVFDGKESRKDWKPSEDEKSKTVKQ